MRLRILLLILAIPASVLAQEKPKQNPFAFEMPKKADDSKPADAKKAEQKKDGGETKAAETPKTSASAAEPAPAAEKEETAAPSSEPAKPVLATQAPAAEPQPVAAVQPAKPSADETKPAAAVQPAPSQPGKTATRAKTGGNSGPLNFRLPNEEQAPVKGKAKKRKPFEFNLPEPKSEAKPQS